MNDKLNSAAIIAVCSHLCVGENVKPFEPNEWAKLVVMLREKDIQPKDLFTLSSVDFMNYFGYCTEQAERLSRLIDRSGSIAFEIEKYEKIGIKIVTRSDDGYPKKLKKTIKNQCPPLFYYMGNLQLCDNKFVGFVGSRDVDEDDISFTRKTVDKVISRGYGIVSGGAVGIDEVSRERALEIGGCVVEYISDSLIKKAKDKNIINAIKSGNLLILSVVKPDSGFQAGIAMMRNRYIYAQSIGTIVVKSDYNKGGTWNGATDNLKNRWCTQFCRINDSYAGNTALIKNGAIPIDENWNADVDSYECSDNDEFVQLSFFDN